MLDEYHSETRSVVHPNQQIVTLAANFTPNRNFHWWSAAKTWAALGYTIDLNTRRFHSEITFARRQHVAALVNTTDCTLRFHSEITLAWRQHVAALENTTDCTRRFHTGTHTSGAPLVRLATTLENAFDVNTIKFHSGI